jgi:seryl-tRNA synthetase
MTAASLATIEVGAPALDAPAVAEALEGALAFCHPAVRGVTVDRATGCVRVSVAGPAAEVDAVRAAVARVVELSAAAHRFVPQLEPLWRRAAAGRWTDGDGALARFCDRFVRPLGPGQWALIGPAARLRAALDRRLAAIAAAAGAEAWHLPSIESTDHLLPRTGYLASHGQYVTWGVHLSPEVGSLERFTRAAREEQLGFPRAEHQVQPTGFILEPLVCHNVYRALAGARLDGACAITALGNCYRFEGHRFAPLVRQWEFSMREAVLLGPGDGIRRLREQLLADSLALCEELDLAATLEVATDPFFVSEAGAAHAFQAMQATKLELRIALGAGQASAAASFNLHGEHFSEPMDLRDRDGRLVETACVGWGLERWLAGFVARWGADPGGWPDLEWLRL